MPARITFPASMSTPDASSRGNFVELRDAGDPVEVALRYDEQGADEITFWTSLPARRPGHHPVVVEQVAEQVFILSPSAVACARG